MGWKLGVGGWHEIIKGLSIVKWCREGIVMKCGMGPRTLAWVVSNGTIKIVVDYEGMDQTL